MSTKDLSHTVIEGGRTGSNKWERRYSHAETRAHEKLYLKEVMADPENWYDYDIEPIGHVYKEFDDKLGPVYRWLHAQVGRPWNDVRSEVSQKFDTRTTAGRHIVHDHLLSSVEVTPDVARRRFYSIPDDPTASHYKNDFYVDDNGLLQRKRYIPRGYKSAPAYDTNQIANWLSGRIVGKVGTKLFWFIPADKNKKRGGVSRTWRTVWSWPETNYGGYTYIKRELTFIVLSEKPIYRLDEFGRKILGENGKYEISEYKTEWIRSYPGAFRQGNKLSNKEIEYFNNLPQYYQDRVLELSPTHPKPVKPSYRNSYY